MTRTNLVAPDPAPRYDDVFAEGVTSMEGEPMTKLAPILLGAVAQCRISVDRLLSGIDYCATCPLLDGCTLLDNWQRGVEQAQEKERKTRGRAKS